MLPDKNFLRLNFIQNHNNWFEAKQLVSTISWEFSLKYYIINRNKHSNKKILQIYESKYCFYIKSNKILKWSNASPTRAKLPWFMVIGFLFLHEYIHIVSSLNVSSECVFILFELYKPNDFKI